MPQLSQGGTLWLTLRSKGRCAIMPRSAPELGHWAPQATNSATPRPSMSRNGLPNYRKLALEAYRPICAYCGFGIKEVLEVAHLDCDPQNNSLGNLALLCPTCHRMHDIDLIPAEIIVRLRDEKRTARWGKLMKDAAAKALETKRGKPGALSAAAAKAVATRRARQRGA